MAEYIISLDNGGTLTKAAIFDLAGNEIAVSSARTETMVPFEGYAERRLDELWSVNCQCLGEVIKKANISPNEIIGISLTGHGKGLYLIGKNDEPLYNGILSTDNRAWEFPQKWKNSGVFDDVYDLICQEIIPGQPVALLAWLKNNNPKVYNQIKYVFSVTDYIRYCLTGVANAEITSLSGTGLYDLKNSKILDVQVLNKLGIEEVADMIAPVCESKKIVAGLTVEAAAACGLNAGTPVAGGLFDIDACALALGMTDETTISLITGTWSINEFISKKPVTYSDIAMNSIYVVPDYYLVEECSPTSAGNLDVVIRLLEDSSITEVPIEVSSKLYQKIDTLVAALKPDDSDVFFIPFMYGSNVHPLAKSCFIGMTQFHTKAHLYKAVFEGVAFSTKYHFEKLLKERNNPEAVRISGGITNSKVWLQMFSDVLNTELEVVSNVNELGALGAAIVFAVGSGKYANFNEATNKMVSVNEIVSPNTTNSEKYNHKYSRYLKLLNLLDEFWHE